MWLEGEAQEPFSGDQAVADESAGIAGVAAQAMNIWLDHMQRFEWGSMGSSFAFSYAPAFLFACFISSERAGFALARGLDYAIWGVPMHLMARPLSPAFNPSSLPGEMRAVYGRLFPPRLMHKLQMRTLAGADA